MWFQAARWILKFEDVPGIEFWSDAKLHLQPRGLFVTSATDILVAPDVASYMEEALKQARLPFEILINDVQVFKKKPESDSFWFKWSFNVV